MEEPSTDTLRKLAPSWTLAGDERLLTILQNTHQKLVARCQEANCQLEQMATALDDASITLQNVNNQFMALSSSQFIESRVYDDDDDVATDTAPVKEAPKPSPPDELSILKRSIAVIESTHEVITILNDSDTESESDDDLPDRLVMKPKDMYADRPLPYIIGSEPWKNKWHAGLLPEDTDTDSSTSKVDRESDQYSLSEPEEYDPVQHSKVQDTIPVPQHVRKLSETSSDLPSEATPTSKPTPSDIASELARRLGGGLPPPKAPEPEYDEPAKPVVSKIYKPQEPVTSTIFPDEPPPLDGASDSEADIFAELHRAQPYKQTYVPNYVSEELFGHNEDEDADIFSDFANQPSSVTKPTSLFDAGPKPHMFDRQPNMTEHAQPRTAEQPRMEQPVRNEQPVEANSPADASDDRGVKKPVGGISLFGSNKGAESIGAAILKRNRRKSSTSGEDSGNDAQEPPPLVNEQQAKKEKDIFDDLFAKNEAKKAKPKVDNFVKDIKQGVQNKKEETIKKDAPKAVDLFSDNLFDDIDDIFTTNIVKSTKDNKKSIFEDDDDLFSEIAEPKTVKQDVKSSSDMKKSLFDSDDDLFSENIPKEKPVISNETESVIKVTENITKPLETPKCFTDDDDLFSKNITKEKPIISNKTESINKVSENITKPKETTKVTKQTTSIFDDDEDDIFSNIKSSKVKEVPVVQNITKNSKDFNVTKNIESSSKALKSPSLFDDDDDDSDLFAKPVKSSNIVQKNDIINKVDTKPETVNKTEVKITDQVTEKNIDITISSPNKVFEANTNVTEVYNIRVEIDKNTETLPTMSVKADDNIIDNDNTNHITVEKEITITEKNKDNEIVSIEKTSVTNSHVTTQEPAKDNVETADLNIITHTTAIHKLLDDHNDKTSDDDFSEQDFDDEPIQETKPNKKNTTIPVIKTTEKDTNIPNIFDNSALEEDIFASPNIPNFDKTDFKDTQKAKISETKVDNKIEIIPSSDIFADIVSEPPAFEKPKEPKKSKNVNALFDDDSDDEALFFKKEDPISDEKPEDFTIKQDRLFGLFTDEPPDVDFSKINDDLDDDLFSTMPTPKIPSDQPPISNLNDDFAIPDEPPVSVDIPIPSEMPIYDDIPRPDSNYKTKNAAEVSNAEKQITSEESKIPVTELKENTDDDIFKLPTKEIKQSEPVKEPSNVNEDIFKEPTSLISNATEKQDDILDDDEELFKSLPIQLPQQKTTTIPKNREIDYRSDEELFKSLPIIEKSQPEKETPKPSANKDMFKTPLQRSSSTNMDLKQEKSEVKKVGKLKVGLNINVNALLPGASPKKVKPLDSPDGQTQSAVEIEKEDSKMTKSVSFDGKPESEVLDNKLSKERPRIQVKRRPSTRKARREAVRKSGIDFGDDSTDNSSSIDDPPKPQPKVETIEATDNKVDNKDTINKKEEYVEPPKLESNVTPTKTEVQPEEVDILSKIEPIRPPVKSDSTTKIKYILNDEDIFNTSALETPEIKNDLSDRGKTNFETPAKTSDVFDSSIDSTVGIKTLSNTYKSPKSNDSKKGTSLFGEQNSDNDDELLFKNKKPIAKSKIFDSDSEEDLFGTSKKVEKVKKTEKVKEVKGSLFGDDDDDDDLFGVKTKKSVVTEPLPQPSRSTVTVKEPVKPTQPVFEDPLSMFGDDD